MMRYPNPKKLIYPALIAIVLWAIIIWALL